MDYMMKVFVKGKTYIVNDFRLMKENDETILISTAQDGTTIFTNEFFPFAQVYDKNKKPLFLGDRIELRLMDQTMFGTIVFDECAFYVKRENPEILLPISYGRFACFYEDKYNFTETEPMENLPLKSTTEKSHDTIEESNKTKKTVISKLDIYTDGSCLCNPGGAGGYGIAFVGDNTLLEELSGNEAVSTNNRMELMSVVHALKTVKEKYCDCKDITLYSDSQYVINPLTKGWLKNWMNNNWKLSSGDEVKNAEIWKELVAILGNKNVKFVWVKGHAGHKYNERCDQIALNAAKQIEEKGN